MTALLAGSVHHFISASFLRNCLLFAFSENLSEDEGLKFKQSGVSREFARTHLLDNVYQAVPGVLSLVFFAQNKSSHSLKRGEVHFLPRGSFTMSQCTFASDKYYGEHVIAAASVPWELGEQRAGFL